MIPFDFEYYRPENLNEAVKLHKELSKSGKAPVYYGGGTELISMAREGSVRFGAVIDIKNIPDCSELTVNNGTLTIGSAVTLTRIAESGIFPLLGETVARIADHTIQDKITIGGNLAGTIIYREASLPFLITDSRLKLMNEKGIREVLFTDVFDGRLRLKKGEFIVQILTDESYLKLPYCHIKKTRIEKIDYPLISLAAIKKDSYISAAVSGLAEYPFLLPGDILSNTDIPEVDRVSDTIAAVQERIFTDLSGSREYRIFVLGNVLRQMLENFKNNRLSQ